MGVYFLPQCDPLPQCVDLSISLRLLYLSYTPENE